MNKKLPPLAVFVALSLTGCPGVSAQVMGPAGTLAEQLLKFDRNGNGRIDAAERAAMQPKQAEEQAVDFDLPLICEGQAFGSGGGGGGSSVTEHNSEAANDRAAVLILRHARRSARLDVNLPEQPQAQQQEDPAEESPESSTEGYPIAEQEPSEQEPLSRSVGLSKAVHYRLLQNRRPLQPQPTQYRQAAVFGAARGLVKRDHRVVVEDRCAPSRCDIYMLARSPY